MPTFFSLDPAPVIVKAKRTSTSGLPRPTGFGMLFSMRFDVRLVPSADQDLDHYPAYDHMKTIDLSREDRTLAELLVLARREPILIHSPSGEDYLLEPADDFLKEVGALAHSDKFMSFLQERSREQGDVPLSEARKKRGL